MVTTEDVGGDDYRSVAAVCLEWDFCDNVPSRVLRFSFGEGDNERICVRGCTLGCVGWLQIWVFNSAV
jgi:hypothetical protein